MQQITKKVDYLVGDDENLNGIEFLPALSIFNEQVMDFFNDLSITILNSVECRQYPDVLTFGFWCRKVSLVKQQRMYQDGFSYLGRGLVFHISPSNLPVIFAYSLAVGLLSGNANIVRLPSKEFWQVNYICQQFRQLLLKEKYRNLSSYIICARYNSCEMEVTKYYSRLCDVRVIWGGDKTVENIRKCELKPKAFDIPFSDRYSLCVIDSNRWLECEDKKRYTRGFYIDTYLNDQNACSSPHLVLWLGDCVEQARIDFWNLLEEMVKAEYKLLGIQAINKLEHFYRMIEKFPDLHLCSNNNYIVRIWAAKIKSELMDYRTGSGFFIESSAKDLIALAPLLGQKCQTISYYGVGTEAFDKLLLETGPHGVDRIVPIGQTLDFSLTWDGYDIIRALSRKISIIRTV